MTELMKGKHEGVGGNESRCGHAVGGAMKPESQRSECETKNRNMNKRTGSTAIL